MSYVEKGIKLFRDGKIDEAIVYLESIYRDESLELSDRYSVASTLAELFVQNGDKGEAKKILEPFNGKYNHLYEFQAQMIWSQILLQEGNYEEANEFMEKLILNIPDNDLYEYQTLKGNLIGTLGHTASRKGELDLAIDYFTKAYEIMKSIGNRNRETAMQFNLAGIYGRKGNYNLAISEFNSVLSKQREANNHLGVGYSNMELGGIYEKMGKLDKAMKCYQEEYDIFEKYGGPTQKAWALTDLGNGHLASGNIEKALEFYLECLPHYESAGDQFTTANIYTYLSKAYRSQDKYDDSIKYAQMAQKLYDQIENKNRSIYSLILSTWSKLEKSGKSASNEDDIEMIEKKMKELDQFSSDLEQLHNDFVKFMNNL